jgi:hypothetical protein
MQLFDYLTTQEDVVLTYNASDMIFAVHSDASYLSKSKACSRTGGHFFLSTNANILPNNGAILNIAHIINHVMASATEAKVTALYIMVHKAIFTRIILEELGHKQSPTPLQTNNTTAEGASSMARSNRSALKLSTCSSTGSVTENANNNCIY